MKSYTYVLAVAVLVFATGCATPYKSNNLTGGYTDTQLAPDVFRVSFRGNGYTSPERAQDFAILRASELALQHGFTHIAIIDEQTRTTTHTHTTEGYAHTTGSAYANGNHVTYSGHTTYTPGQTVTFYKPQTGLVFQGFKTKPEGVFAFDAAFLQQSLRQTYRIK